MLVTQSLPPPPLLIQSTSQLLSLAVLDVTKNKLEHLPERLSRLSLLSDLHASENCIEALPDDIGMFVLELPIFKMVSSVKATDWFWQTKHRWSSCMTHTCSRPFL